MKSYKIKTIEQIFEAINEKNVDGFLQDFEMYLKTYLKLRAMDNELFSVRPDMATFRWNDDGQWGVVDRVVINIINKKNETP